MGQILPIRLVRCYGTAVVPKKAAGIAAAPKRLARHGRSRVLVPGLSASVCLDERSTFNATCCAAKSVHEDPHLR